MIDSFLWATPVLMIGVVALLVFVGCDVVLGLDRVEPKIPILKVTAGDMRVELSWPTDPNSGGFKVYRGLTSGGPYEFLATVENNGTAEGYPDIAVINGTTYYYVVTAIGGDDGETDQSNEESATPNPEMVTEFLQKTADGTTVSASGWFGMQIEVGASPIKIRQLGRSFITGNNQIHVMKIVDAAFADVGAPVAVQTTIGAGEWRYALVPDMPPLILNAGQRYYIVSQETSPGDVFWNHNTQVAPTTAAGTDATIIGAARNMGATFLVDANGSVAYGLVNFKYQVQ
ncbi:MAG TPA: hypothetical protein VM939_04810 [Gemmatimonadaceae bacterium]|nr:hypothetical protein [Gemmatimonadaceae bacterium]